jgi:hypothetical protein
MRTAFFRLAGLTALFGVLIAPAARAAQVHVGVQIGVPAPVVVGPRVVVAPPVVVAPRRAYVAPVVVPPPGYVWQGGFYMRTAYGPRWVAGAWVPAHVPHGHAYGYWRNHGYR